MAKIRAIVAVPEVGETYDGIVKSIMPYGCFVEILPGKEGLLHISEIAWKRLETVEEAGIKEGDHIQVKLLEIDPKTGKYKLSHRVLEDKPEGYVERPRRPRGERGDAARGQRLHAAGPLHRQVQLAHERVADGLHALRQGRRTLRDQPDLADAGIVDLFRVEDFALTEHAAAVVKLRLQPHILIGHVFITFS